MHATSWTLFWIVLAPVTLTGWVPYRLAGSAGWSGGIGSWAGLWLLVNGLGLALWSAWWLRADGGGSPVPWHPPVRLVTGGPYRSVRHPLASGLILMLIGHGLMWRTPAVWLYGGALAIGIMVWGRTREEPELVRRFGLAYLAYQRRVPRWLPKPAVRRASCAGTGSSECACSPASPADPGSSSGDPSSKPPLPAR
ncbi:MAG TPA: isoprenylcysteine carboxylmethyltransferase family protein [bacterium]